MGTIIHKTIIIESSGEDEAWRCANKADDLGLIASKPISAAINGSVFVFIVPDGSKLGWKDEEDMREARDQLIVWLSVNHITAVMTTFGDVSGEPYAEEVSS